MFVRISGPQSPRFLCDHNLPVSDASPRDSFDTIYLLRQDTHDRRSKLFQLLILEQCNLQKKFDDQEAELKKKEELHQAEVDRLKEDVSRCTTLFDVLKKDLEQALLGKAKAEKQHDDTLAALSARAQNDQKLKQICEDHEAKSKKAEAELADFKKKSAKWLSELNLLNRDMDRKLAESTSSFCSSSRLAFQLSGC